MRALSVFVVAAALVALTAAQVAENAEDIVEMKLGKVRGKVEADARIFLGIPYAKPPVADLRFRKPERYDTPFDTTYEATEHKAGCFQKCTLPQFTCPKELSEDCLYLNVYTPRLAAMVHRPPLPVMVFIHGGRYDKGGIDTSLYDARNLAAQGRVIVVTLQYRLGSFGFLYLENTDITGQFAILDQRMALEWVRDNILAFGGEPDEVTLFGQSAGAISVAVHLVAESSGGLFHRAIMQSNPFSIGFKPKYVASEQGRMMAVKLKCISKRAKHVDWQQVAECLRNKVTKEQILAAQESVKDPRTLTVSLSRAVPWAPYLDGDILKDNPVILLRQGRWNQVPLIMGSTKDDALMFVHLGYKARLWYSPLVAFIEVMFGVSGHGSQALQMYKPKKLRLFKDNRQYLSNILTDYLFTCPARWIANGAHQEKWGDAALPQPTQQPASNALQPATEGAGFQAPNVYLYTYHSAPSDPNLWGASMAYCKKKGKSCHCAELPSVFKSYELSSLEPTAGETQLADIMIRQWAAFAHHSDPNQDIDGKALPQWTPFTKNKRHTMLFDSNGSGATVQEVANYRDDYCDLMDKSVRYS